MTRTPFIAALILLATVTSAPRAVGPRRPAAAAHAARPHAAVPHASPTFTRPRTVARPHVSRPATAPRNGFVPRRSAPVVRSRPQTVRPSRPAVTTRPRPTTPHVANRPNIINRPSFNPTTVNRPRINQTTVNRPRINQTTVNRTAVNQFNRSRTVNRVGGNRTNVFTGGRGGVNPYARGSYGGRTRGRYAAAGRRWGGGGRQIGAAASWYSSPGNWGRSWWGGSPAWYWGEPWYWQHSHWHHGFWDYWSTPPALWFGAGLATGWLLSPYDTVAYSNPYFVATGPVFFDYSTPLPAVPVEEDALAFPPDPDTLTDPDTPPPPPAEGPAADANRLLDDARAAFQAGDYPKAQELVDAAIKANPSDPTLHEFRALTLFAQGNYQEDAATLYAVLTAGPGWDWPTMRDMYPDVATYTAQLRTLEKFVGANPTAAYGHFDLAYQYLVTGAKDAAIRELQQVVKLQPDDKLSQELLTSLTAPATAGDANAPPMPGQ